MELTFEKWEDGRWFVVLPDYDGDQEDLAGSWEDHGDRYIGSLFRVDEPVPDDSVTRRVPPKRAQSTMSLA